MGLAGLALWAIAVEGGFSIDVLWTTTTPF